ncbi:cellulose signaling related protein ooc1 [Coniochaeta ligniaria NRRL 30616]|uniref:Cellulose signaling related protein ooc1 n=1 Tax=Coniochaeta ligniaria NRRL 30616 TaxID=1408157 RepID=A0A1J7J8M9_9PEZI|nr:cellulose signaling related protein ooc1 [Coniochaeta ligniaria NRRL 30616]
MMFTQALAGFAGVALLALAPTASAFDIACTYQEYRCGYSLVSLGGYNITELTEATNRTGIIPPLTSVQLLQVLYRCKDVSGTLVGNSFCIAGCISMGDNTEDDQCVL